MLLSCDKGCVLRHIVAPWRTGLITFFFLKSIFTGSVAESQGLQGLLQEDEGAKDPLSSPAAQRCASYYVTAASAKLFTRQTLEDFFFSVI